jgi:hypothetical protein
MTEGVVGMVMFAGTSREVWETLAGMFTATSFARSSGLCQQMVELKKRDMKVNVYFHNMKALADELTSIGQPLRDDELISYILAGLPKEFDALYEVVNNRTTSMQVRDLYSQFEATEHLHNSCRPDELHYPAAHYAAPPSPLYGAAAHAATYGQPRGRPSYRPYTRPPPPSYQPKALAAPPGAKPNTSGRTIVFASSAVYRVTPRPSASNALTATSSALVMMGATLRIKLPWQLILFLPSVPMAPLVLTHRLT